VPRRGVLGGLIAAWIFEYNCSSFVVISKIVELHKLLWLRLEPLYWHSRHRIRAVPEQGQPELDWFISEG
jgi:hypothetical protein